MRRAQEKLGGERWQFYPGRELSQSAGLSRRGPAAPFSPDTRTTPPHDLTDKSVLDDYPRGPGSDLLNQLMARKRRDLRRTSGQCRPAAAGKPPATNIWLWGLGSTPRLPPFAELYGKQGAMITAVDLLRGLAALIGWRRIEVPGATGYLDTDYAAKGRYAVEALKDVDLVCVHVEATDEASHEGDAAAKIKALEEIDRHIVGPVHEALKDLRRLSHPGHARPSHAAADQDPQPRLRAVCHGRHRRRGRRRRPTYDDPTADDSRLVFDEGWKLMRYFLE